MKEQLALLPGYLTAHLQLSLLALAIGALVSIPLGVWVTRHRSWVQVVLGTAGVIQTIPGLALLALMVPALAFVASLGVELRSIGFLPALIALSLYSVLPILQTTVAGIDGVEPALVEAAQGVGMTDRQRLLRVELPLALPMIVAGLRTATVWVIGTATLSTPVGATSLGNYIFSGLQTRNLSAVLVGCLAAASLAIVLDQTIRVLESGVRARKNSRVFLAATTLLALYLYAGASAAWDGGARDQIVIGSKTFTEQYILSEVLAGRIEQETGLQARAVQSLGSTVLFDALKSGEIDAYIDYSGTIWATIMQRTGTPATRQEVFQEVRQFLADQHGIVLAAALGFENTYALGMRRDRAKELGVQSISDLARVGPELEIGGDYEFFVRAEWEALQKVYGLKFRARRSMDSSLMYRAVAAREVDVITAFSTDGRIAAFELTLLEDDRAVIPPYDAIVLVSRRRAEQHPHVVRALASLQGILDEAAMQQLNRAVDLDGRSPAEVARSFLQSLPQRGPEARRLLGSEPADKLGTSNPG